MPQPSKVLVVGGSGNIGRLIISELLEHSSLFTVSTLTRPSSTATFDPSINVIRAEYTPSALTQAFTGQDIVICTIGTYSLGEQLKIAQAAVQAGVKRYVPAEYGLDTSDPKALEVSPCLTIKTDVVKYLREHEDVISWTAVLTGLWIDMTATHSDWPWWSVQERRMTIFDDGNTPFEGSTIAQAARATVSAILPQNLAETKNKYIHIRSAVWTQNQLLRLIQKYTGTTDQDWKFDHVSVAGIADQGQRAFQEAASSGKTAEDLLSSRDFQGAVGNLITAALMGNGGVNQFGEKPGPWLQSLGLQKEDPDNVVREFVMAVEGKA